VKVVTAALWLAMGGFGFTATVEADDVTSIRIELPSGINAVMTNIYAVFARQVESRCGAKVVLRGEAPLTVTLVVDPAIGTEGFRISHRTGGRGVPEYGCKRKPIRLSQKNWIISPGESQSSCQRSEIRPVCSQFQAQREST
jgi:hypothetical protein